MLVPAGWHAPCSLPALLEGAAAAGFVRRGRHSAARCCGPARACERCLGLGQPGLSVLTLSLAGTQRMELHPRTLFPAVL